VVHSEEKRRAGGKGKATAMKNIRVFGWLEAEVQKEKETARERALQTKAARRDCAEARR